MIWFPHLKVCHGALALQCRTTWDQHSKISHSKGFMHSYHQADLIKHEIKIKILPANAISLCLSQFHWVNLQAPSYFIEYISFSASVFVFVTAFWLPCLGEKGEGGEEGVFCIERHLSCMAIGISSQGASQALGPKESESKTVLIWGKVKMTRASESKIYIMVPGWQTF